MKREVCLKCNLFFKIKRMGVFMEEGMPGEDELAKFPKGWKSYKIWCGDLMECKGCGTKIISGFANLPVSEHYMRDSYKALRQKLIETEQLISFVGDC